MTDETPAPTPEQAPPATPEQPVAELTAPAGPSASEAWNDVVARMGELGTALSAWAKSAVDDPQNKQRLDQVRSGVNEMARQADTAFTKVASSDFGQQVSQGAQQAGDAIGDAAQQVSDAAAPHVARAFSGLAGFFGQAAGKVDEAASRKSADIADPATPAAAAPAEQPAPVAPAPAAPPAPTGPGADDPS